MVGTKAGATNGEAMLLHDCEFGWRELSADGDHIVIARSEATTRLRLLRKLRRVGSPPKL
jgi:hypothetical protein